MEERQLAKVRMLKIEIEHFKNVEFGAFTFPSYTASLKQGTGKGQDIIGIYGQNGSGKTALVEALTVWALLQQKMPLPESYSMLIKENSRIQILFHIEYEGKWHLLKHTYGFGCEEIENPRKHFACRHWENEKWSRWKGCDVKLAQQLLEDYAARLLWIATPRQLGLVHLNMGTTYDFALHESSGIFLFQENTILTSHMPHVYRVVEQINIVVQAFLSGLTISIKEIKTEEKDQCKFLLMANRYDTEFPLSNESGGVKRLLSILSILIAVYHNPCLCVVVDELDAGIYEYLLGEILAVMRDGVKGQFLFTSHNLRALEVLGSEHIVFSTSNPKNRYIQFSSHKKWKNLRDEYLRAIVIGGQKEPVYEETGSYPLGYAFRKAGKLYDKT